MIDLADAHRLWGSYRAVARDAPAELPTVGPFGDTPELADELLALVLLGRKRATATLLAEFAAEGDELPRIGDHWIVTDSVGRPRVILRTIELRIGPFLSVDAGFAFDEGEDDRTRASWVREHRRYWQRQCARLGLTWSEDADVLFERFEAVFAAPRV
ncbi:ASCH domain-containing protein [Leifsonia sp. TF02-11]|uniref:ASCH domain-containing protein n=1 Tax=Leifsonia sp. TF02-11 TaxID=2815212 RepID=UPI001AA14CB3|nr:ASCH domain-containing protein [Leifsonia sp. TF02-11]MBO1739189.1 ASCH domain-containing protein [Leifsonia sp. TF02-11]